MSAEKNYEESCAAIVKSYRLTAAAHRAYAEYVRKEPNFTSEKTAELVAHYEGLAKDYDNLAAGIGAADAMLRARGAA